MSKLSRKKKKELKQCLLGIYEEIDSSGDFVSASLVGIVDGIREEFIESERRKIKKEVFNKLFEIRAALEAQTLEINKLEVSLM